jgi:hypothetical protein
VDFVFLCKRKQIFIYIYEKVNQIIFLKLMIIFKISILCALLSDCLAMFDWQAELAPPIPIPLVQSQSPPSLSVVRYALVAPVVAQTVPPPPKSFAAILGGASTCVAEDVPFPVPCLKGDTLSIKIG